jgi:phosphoribosylanthranilate isomerase
MPHRTQIKICGLNSPEALQAALLHGAAFGGLVFYSSSPRAVSPDFAASLCAQNASRIKMVGLFVDPDDDFLDSVTQRAGLDMIQLHGHEDARRVQAVRARTGLPVIKAIRVASRDDLKMVPSYEAVSDWLLFDTKVEGQAGGTGVPFDWTILKDFKSRLPWMLSGGLNADNVGTALSLLKPSAVDVSSGVEDRPGVKSAAKIKIFIEAAENFFTTNEHE